MEVNGGEVRCEERDSDAATQAERTEESGSRRRRTTADWSLVRWGEREFPWCSERTETSRRHWRRTGDLSEESVAAIDETNGGRASAERVLAMDSSSNAAAEWVSLSESL